MNNKIAIMSNESEFCMNLAHSNFSIGRELIFPDNINKLFNIELDIVIIDLNDKYFNAFKIGKNKFTLIGVMNKLNKKIEQKAKNNGYDIVFTKKMFVKNYKAIIQQIANA